MTPELIGTYTYGYLQVLGMEGQLKFEIINLLTREPVRAIIICILKDRCPGSVPHSLPS